MCGILAVISNGRHNRLDDQTVVAMRDTMTARGPDGSGLYRENNITMAHRRLAIRDLAGGGQPFFSSDNRLVTVYNGEIYNDDELRKELRALGVQFKTASDTEVLVEAWAQWGSAALDRLRGMFGFAIFDRRSKELWIVRDRCGVKPLFYADVGGDLVVASSIAAIRRHPQFRSRPNMPVISHYLQTLRLTMDRETVFEGIYSVRPAEMIRIRKGCREFHRYWSLPTEVDDSLTFEEAADQLQTSIEDSLRLRLKSDVPVGMMMSGGVDSNTLASVMHNHRGSNVLGVCGGGVEDTKPDTGGDFQFAQQCAAGLGFEYREARVDSSRYLETWQQLVASYETPVSTPTDVVIYHVAQQLRESVGVAIGGEGADEAFCGYEIAHWSGADFERSSALHRRTIQFRDAPDEQVFRQSLVRQYGRDQFGSPADHYLSANGLISPGVQASLFSSNYRDAVGWGQSTSRYYETLFAKATKSSMNEKYAELLFQVNLESLLGRLDSATMAAGLEARVPYTDHVLVEQAFKMPHRFRIDVSPRESQPWLSSLDLSLRGSLRSKRVLRTVAGRIMPADLARRPKMSFPTPLNQWLDQQWKPWIRAKLTTSDFAREIFEPRALRELTEIPAAQAMWNWPVLNTILWGQNCFC